MTTTSTTRAYATPNGKARAHITDTGFDGPMITALCGQRMSLYGVSFGPRPTGGNAYLCARCRRRADYRDQERLDLDWYEGEGEG